MTPRSVFILVLKILGVVLMKDMIFMLPSVFASLSFIFQTDDIGFALFNLITGAAIVFMYGFVLYLLIFRTDIVLAKLPLEKHFTEDRFTLNVHRSTIVQLAVIIVGGIIVITSFPSLLRQLYIYFQQRQLTRGMSDLDISDAIIHAFQFLLGGLLVYNSKEVTNFIELRRKGGVPLPEHED
jgi:hypothetical protein